MPAGAGTPRYEKPDLWLARRILLHPTRTPVGAKHLASRSLRLALRSLRPRYIGLGEIVADSSTDVLPRGIGAWIPACAGMTIGGIGGFRSHDPRRVKSIRIGGRQHHFRTNPPCRQGPAHQGVKSRICAWHGGFCYTPPGPQRGTSTSPRVVFDSPLHCVACRPRYLPRGIGARFPPARESTDDCRGDWWVDSRLRGNDDWGDWWVSKSRSKAGKVIPDRSPGHAFISNDEFGAGSDGSFPFSYQYREFSSRTSIM